MRKSIPLILLLFLTAPMLFAQKNIGDSAIFTNLIYAHYSFNVPGGDMGKRFGAFSQVGPGFAFKTRKNLMLGVEGSFSFGNRVNDQQNILGNITTSEGHIIDLSGIYADYSINEQGFSAMAKIGKVIPAWGPNVNSGILLSLAGGYIQHKIFIDHKDKTAPQIVGDYLKGYDELKRGFVSNVFLGYLYLGNSNKVNFVAGIEFNLAFTQDARPYSFARAEYTNGKYTDVYTGLKVGWIFPVYKRAPKEFYYF